MEGRRETENVCTNQQMQLDWNKVNWKKVKHRVNILQQKIFRDTQVRNYKSVNQTQKLLTRSLFK